MLCIDIVSAASAVAPSQIPNKEMKNGSWDIVFQWWKVKTSNTEASISFENGTIQKIYGRLTILGRLGMQCHHFRKLESFSAQIKLITSYKQKCGGSINRADT